MIVNIYKNDFKITFDDLFFFGGGVLLYLMGCNWVSFNQ